ncbi:hypothetical protein BDY24DRAFT_407351 [Mrakia frigida]|uniref:uncharacterized protein n=1 Tax=Mrakia frigida TaxID=29902 RepID=UPI003FCBF852
MAQYLDQYFLALTFLVTLGWQCLGFFLAYTLQVDKFTDLWGGSNFFMLALLTLTLGGTYSARNIVASVFVMIWSIRLGGFLFFRVLKTKSDGRFDEMRQHFLKFAGFWIFQVLWVWVVSLPTVILNSPAVSKAPNLPAFGTGRDIAGIVLFVIGFTVEAVSDWQKYQHKQADPPKPKNKPCTDGFWKWSRHPPYFGEILLHWGLWMLCLSPSIPHEGIDLSASYRKAQFAAIFSPLLTMALLLFLSGMPLAEKSSGKKFWLMSYGKDGSDGGSTWKNYTTYLHRTSILIPIPPALYAPIPSFIKSTLLFDFPFYKFNGEGEDAKKAVDEQRGQEEEGGVN